VRKRLMAGGAMGNSGGVKMDIKPAPKSSLPIITFDHDVSVHLNGEDIRALHYPHGHTDGDSVIFFPSQTWCTWAMTSSPTVFRSWICKAAAASKA